MAFHKKIRLNLVAEKHISYFRTAEESASRAFCSRCTTGCTLRLVVRHSSGYHWGHLRHDDIEQRETKRAALW